ncbi:MAG: helix-turn-helix transcriptional regulator, partial [Alphaproteobacteria bacterium]
MRRADRLFQLIQELRGRRGVTTGRDLAEALEVSVRTIYRDVADLMASGVPIEGEPGIGYMLRGGFDLPPLMFDVEEIEALVLGGEIVSRWGDPELATAARRALDKIATVLPDRLRDELLETALFAPPTRAQTPFTVDLAQLRRAIRSRSKIHFSYSDEHGNRTTRAVRPLGLAFYG